jgi:RNA polymerase sigma factor (sigma-70 family)
MGSRPTLKHEWTLNEDALDGLLLCFDPDREQAGLKYESARRKLIDFFRWNDCHRGPEELADETLDRVARKVCEGEEIQNIHAYLHRVASNVLKESHRARRQRAQSLEVLPSHKGPVYDPAESEFEESEQEETRRSLECLQRCLQELPAEARKIITDYYGGEKESRIAARKELARREGLTMSALRLRAYYLRLKLEKCCRKCLRRLSA